MGHTDSFKYHVHTYGMQFQMEHYFSSFKQATMEINPLVCIVGLVIEPQRNLFMRSKLQLINEKWENGLKENEIEQLNCCFLTLLNRANVISRWMPQVSSKE